MTRYNYKIDKIKSWEKATEKMGICDSKQEPRRQPRLTRPKCKADHGGKQTHPCDDAVCEIKFKRMVCENCRYLSKKSTIEKVVWLCANCKRSENAEEEDSEEEVSNRNPATNQDENLAIPRMTHVGSVAEENGTVVRTGLLKNTDFSVEEQERIDEGILEFGRRRRQLRQLLQIEQEPIVNYTKFEQDGEKGSNKFIMKHNKNRALDRNCELTWNGFDPEWKGLPSSIHNSISLFDIENLRQDRGDPLWALNRSLVMAKDDI